MCGFEPISMGLGIATSLAQGLSGFMAGNANAAAAKAEGDALYRQSRQEAGLLGLRANADLGRDRAAAAASGFSGDSAAEALASKAGTYGLDIDRILEGGRAARDAKRMEAKMARQQGVGALVGGVVSAAGGVLGQYGSAWFGGGNPAVASPGTYGQLGRYGSSNPLLSSSGRLIGGV